MEQKENELSRRSFFKTTALAAAAIFFGRWSKKDDVLAAGEDWTQRPPGTCMLWQDATRDGDCDISTGENPKCNAIKCPAHAANPRRELAKEQGAVAGCCALYNDEKKTGYCERSARAEKACTNTVCPGHMNNEERKKKAEEKK